MLGVNALVPKPMAANHIVSTTQIHQEPALRLVNAALSYQISKLTSSDLQRFSDSLSSVIIYLSGASPAVADNFDRAGWWKLSYPVALRYGLKINKNIDERFDFEKSTRAAFNYAKELQKTFGTQWKQAFIEGPLAVKRPASLFADDSLKLALNALSKLIGDSHYTKAEEYAVQYFYANVKTWKADERVYADVIIEKTGMPEGVFYALNPDLRGKIIPAKTSLKLTNLALANLKKSEADIVLLSNARIEEGTIKIAAAQEQVKNNATASTPKTSTVYKVKPGDNLGFIAERYGVNVKEIKSWNNLRSDVIWAGQKLVLYSKKDRQPVTASISTSTAQKPAQKPSEIKTGDFIAYRVKSGDTLWSIAQKFPGVSADNLMAWNGISAEIKVGQQLKVLKSEISNYNADAYPDFQ
jgi:membrane-bound lytic murein transglycosylase D